MSEFLNELSRHFAVYATGENDAAVMACVSDKADELWICAYVASNGFSYKANFNEHTSVKAKRSLTDDQDWAYFFEVLRCSFNNANISVKLNQMTHGSAAVDRCYSADAASADGEDCLEVQCTNADNGRCAIFVLNRVPESMQMAILSRMLQSHQIHNHPKEYEQRLVQIKAEEESARAKREGLDRELMALNENLSRNHYKIEADTQRKKSLLQKLGSYKEDDSHNAWKLVHESQRKAAGEGNMSRFPNPLGNRHSKEFDHALLQLIKSRWMTLEECNRSSPANSVVLPLSSSELETRVSKLSGSDAVVWKCLDLIDAWNYSVFDVQRAMSGDDYLSLPMQDHGGSLLITMYALLVKYNFMQKFNIDERVMLNWISVVEAGYKGNPYHNSMHAADVLQITHYIISQGGLAKRCDLSDLQIFSGLFAAAIHDFEHPGINNNFHMKTSSYLATLYNDRSVLENLHVSSVFELMKDPAFNILANFTDEQRREIRETVIEMVLATDMGSHGKYLARLKAKMQERANFTTPEEQVLGLATALKVADVSNCGRPNDIYLRWSAKVSDEFYQQGDRERNLGMSCSPFMDRLSPGIAKGQIAFMNYIIIPFFELVAEFLPNMRFAVTLAEENKSYWGANDDS